MSAPLRVLVADDHPMFREGLRFVLGREADLVVVGEAATGAETLRLTEELDPDVVVMDLAMPDVGGLAATRRLTDRGARARVLVLTMSEDDESVLAALRAGAGGYLVKGAAPEQVVSAVRGVGQGHAVFGPSLAARLLTFFAEPRTRDPAAVPRAVGPGRRGADAPRGGTVQRGDRPGPVHLAHHRPEPRQQHLRQAARVQSPSGHAACPRRAGRRSPMNHPRLRSRTPR